MKLGHPSLSCGCDFDCEIYVFPWEGDFVNGGEGSVRHCDGEQQENQRGFCVEGVFEMGCGAWVAVIHFYAEGVGRCSSAVESPSFEAVTLSLGFHGHSWGSVLTLEEGYGFFLDLRLLPVSRGIPGQNAPVPHTHNISFHLLLPSDREDPPQDLPMHETIQLSILASHSMP